MSSDPQESDVRESDVREPNPHDAGPREIELKFALSAAAFDQIRWEVFGDAPPRRLRAIYFDTPTAELAHHGVVARLRSDGERWVQTVKGRGAVARSEDEVERAEPVLDRDHLRRAAPDVPEATLEALAPAFETQIDRRVLTLSHGAATLEAALDQGAIVAGEARSPVCELELELTSGEAVDLFAAARQMCRRDGVRLSLTSKAERGYRLALRGETGLRSQPPRPDATVGEAFQELALADLLALCEAAAAVGEGGEAAGPVHRARVALRRLRVLVAAFEPALGDDRIGAIKAELKRMTAVFADTRSLDVLAESLAGPLAPPADEPGVQDAVRRARSTAHGRSRAAVDGLAFAGALLDVAEWIVCGPWTRDPTRAETRDRPLGDVAGEILKRRRRRMRRRGGKLDWSDAHARHKLRIQAKKMHYLVDALAPEDAAAPFYRRLKRLQAHLGDLNDLATAGATARLALGPGVPAVVALALGVELGRREEGERRLIRKARRAFRKWSEEPPVDAARD